MLWVLIGQGPNSVEIPALIWSDREIALSECKALLGNKFDTKVESKRTSYHWVYDGKGDGFRKSITSKLYTSYYDGCGACYAVILKSVEEGKPFVRWDLD
jgi:hypothetical protein